MSAADAHLTPKILHEDADLIAIDKPAGLLSHGAADVPSALAWLQQRELAAGRDPERVHLVHRLDKETSGVLLLAFSAEMANELGALFRDRKVLKFYLALTSPVPPLRWLRVEHRLRPRRIGGGEFMDVVGEGGLEASSEIEVLSRGRRFALVRVIPEQGRKHQVRVALAATGAPICGDFLYGGPLVARLAKRIMLHARALEFAHPRTGQHMALRAPLPADFRAMIAEDSGNVPVDLDRRHRTAPAGRDRARDPDAPGHRATAARAGTVKVPRSAPKPGQRR